MVKQVNSLRALAILAIVALHVTSGQVNSNFNIFIVNQAVRFASPLFIIISGMILCYIEVKRPSPSYAYFLKRRFSKVALPYILWTFLYTLYTAIVVDDIHRHWQWSHLNQVLIDGLNHLWMGTGFVHLYFILIMVQLYAIFPFLYKWLQSHPTSLVVTSFFVTLGCLSAIYLHQFGIIRLPSSPIPYVTLSLNWVFYFVLGMIVAEYQDRWIQALKGTKKIGTFLLICLGSFFILLYDGKLTGTYAISVKPSTLLFALCSFMFLFSLIFTIQRHDTSSSQEEDHNQAGLIVHLSKMIDSSIQWIAKNSFLIYLLHPLCLGILVRGSIMYGFHDLWMDEIGVTYLLIATTALTFLGLVCINLLPFARSLGGNPIRLRTTRSQVKKIDSTG